MDENGQMYFAEKVSQLDSDRLTLEKLKEAASKARKQCSDELAQELGAKVEALYGSIKAREVELRREREQLLREREHTTHEEESAMSRVRRALQPSEPGAPAASKVSEPASVGTGTGVPPRAAGKVAPGADPVDPDAEAKADPRGHWGPTIDAIRRSDLAKPAEEQAASEVEIPRPMTYVGPDIGFVDEEPSKAVTKYVDQSMFTAEPIDDEAMETPRVYLLSATPDPLGAIAAFAMIYEGRVVRDLRDITDAERKTYWEDCFKTALQTPLEAFDLHFMVEGLTRASWDQMVRQRTAVFAGESLRFAVKEPLSAAVRPGPMIAGQEQIWYDAVESIETAYRRLIAAGVPAEDARGLLPLNVLVRGHWKTNFRNFYAEVGKRLCTQAQWEWRAIHAAVREAIARYVPNVPGLTDSAGLERPNWQFRYIAESNVFKPICFQKGACMFKAKADRGCTIRERVDQGRFSDIDPSEWLLDPTAGFVWSKDDWAQPR